MPQVRRDVVKERARRLRHKGTAALARHLDAQVGTTRRVLAESHESGRTEHFTQVRLNAPIEPGVIVEVGVIGHDGRRLIAA
jgi:threonylcarbamoyladenosine tRNA methylthiotransferase MtaB